jgi:hypothetical protein
MKIRAVLFLFFFVSYFANATIVSNPIIPILSNLEACDQNYDGIETFDLSVQTPIILAAQSTPASDYNVSYHLTPIDASAGVNQLFSNSYVNITNSQYIYVRVQNIITSEFEVGSFQLIVFDQVTPIFSPLSALCQNSAPPVLPSASTNGIVGTWAPSTIDTSIVGAQIFTFFPYIGQCANVVTMVVVVNPNLSIIGIGYTIVNNSGVQTLTVDTSFIGNYTYSLDGGPSQSSPIFQNIPLGNHIITVTDLDGCGSIIIDNINVNLTSTPPPTGNSSQSFATGATLENLQVSGQYVQWYSGANKSSVSSPLPLNMLLVDGTTYYASQKIGGYESASRLPVTVQLVLNSVEFELKELSFEPNPVVNYLNLKSNENIDSIFGYNLVGQEVLFQKTNSSELKIDLTNLNAGTYFFKAYSKNKIKVFKIIKK